MTDPRRRAGTIVGQTHQIRERDPQDEPGPPPRWSRSTGDLDVFWPILAVILIVAVVFVAGVAHRSMDGVGVASSPHVTFAPTPVSTPAPSTLLIVQVSSHPTRGAAESAVAALDARGFSVHILDSDDYRPLNPGFFVVYSGPYPRTAAGRTAAKRVQAKLVGALVRDVHTR